MGRVFSGYIPDRLKYVQRAPSEVRMYREDKYMEDDEPKEAPISLRETFVVDATNEKTLKTAREWAGARMTYQENTFRLEDPVGMSITELPNDPIPALELVTLEVRGEGGRAWKVLVHGQHYVDLREDPMLDALRHGPGVRNGEILGPWVWACFSGQMKLVRVGSRMHRAAVEAGKLRVTKPSSVGELVMGGIYANKKNEQAVFLGVCRTTTFELRNADKRSTYGDKWVPRYDRFSHQGQLWFKIGPNGFQGFERTHEPAKGMWETGSLTMVGKRTVVKKVGEVPVPEDYLAQIRASAVVKGNHSHKETGNGFYSKDHRLSNAAYHAWKALIIHENGFGIDRYPEFVDYLKDHIEKQPRYGSPEYQE